MPETSQSQQEEPEEETKTFLQSVDMETLTDEQAGFVNSLRLMEDELSQLAFTGAQVKDAIAEMFPPATLFSPALRSMPFVYRDLRNWLDERGANMQQHSSRRIMMTIATQLYTESEDREAAIELVKNIIAAGRRTTTTTGSSSSTPPPVSQGYAEDSNMSGMDRTAHNIALRFKESSSKFSGNLGESWMEFVAEYQQVARDYRLSPRQKLQYLHNLLRADAKRFYLDRVDGYATGFQQAVDLVESEYNSVVRQNRVKTYLGNLRMSSFAAEGLEPAASLEKTYKLITKLAPQVPRSHRGDAHKVEFLRNAVVGNSWATEPLSRIATHGLSFQQLYGELEAALHLDREAKLATIRDGATRRSDRDEEVPGILYEGQGRYVKHHVGLRGNYGRGKVTREKFDPLSVMGCFNCDDPSHTIGKCPNPINAVRAAKKKLEYYAKKNVDKRVAYVILFELCHQLDLPAQNTNEDPEILLELGASSEGDIEEKELFDALVAKLDDSDTSNIESAQHFSPRD